VAQYSVFGVAQFSVVKNTHLFVNIRLILLDS
jgi:hypothetical protein